MRCVQDKVPGLEFRWLQERGTRTFAHGVALCLAQADSQFALLALLLV